MTLLAALAVISVVFGVAADEAGAETAGPPTVISSAGPAGAVTVNPPRCLVSGRDFVETGADGSLFIVTNYTLNVNAVSPYVYGYANVATTWVTSEAQLIDLTTGTVTNTGWPAWQAATATKPATFPTVPFAMARIADTYKVQYNIWWSTNGVLTGHEVLRSNRYIQYFAYHNQTKITQQASCFVS